MQEVEDVDNPSRRSRRAFLAATGTTTVGLAGCLQPLLEEGAADEPAAAGPPPGSVEAAWGATAGASDRSAATPLEITERWRTGGFYSDVPATDGETLVSAAGESIVAIDPASGSHLWEYETDGRVYADVELGPDRVYGGGEAGVLSALDREDGDLEWEFPVPTDDVRIRSRSVVGEDLVAVADADGVTYGLDRDTGAQRWSIEGHSIGIQHASRALGQFVDGEFVLQGGDRGHVRVVAPDGTVRWSGDDRLAEAPTVREDVVVATTLGGDVVAYDRANGRELWRVDLESSSSSRPSIADDLVVLGTDAGVQALALEDGDRRWHQPTDAAVTARTPIYRNHVFAPDADGVITVLDPADGDVVREYAFDVPGGAEEPPSLYTAPVFVEDDLVLYVSASLVSLSVEWDE